MAGRLAYLSEHSTLVKAYNVGKAASGDRSVWLATVRDPDVSELKTTRILILCRQHGDEPVSTEAAMGFLERVAAGAAPGVPNALKHTSLYIMPMVNPDGADKLTRRNQKGIDLNRDWGRFAGVETQAAYRVFKAVRPQFVVDMHSWDKEDPYRANCLEAPRMSSAVSRVTREIELRARQEVGEGTGQELSEIGYDSGAESTLCHRFMLEKMRTPSLLFETTAGMDEGGDFVRRVDLARAMILWLVRDTSASPDAWRRVAANANAPVPRPNFAFGGSSLTETRVASALPSPHTVQPKSPDPFRLPRTIWWALGMSAALFLIVGLSPTIETAGYVRVERSVLPDGRRISRGVYVHPGSPTRRP